MRAPPSRLSARGVRAATQPAAYRSTRRRPSLPPPPPSPLLPAVFPDGTLCLDIIQDKWKPIYTVEMILTSIQSLLCDPNNDSPANMDAAKMMRTDMKEYKKRVRRLAQKSVEG